MKSDTNSTNPHKMTQELIPSLMQFATIRLPRRSIAKAVAISVFAAILVCATSCRLSNAQQPPPAQAPSPSPSSTSPDKKWEYVGGDRPKLVKAGTNEVVIDFLEQCDLGAAGEHSATLWAPDSRRLAFFSCGAGKEHLTLLYQLREDHWITVQAPRDELFQRVGNMVQAQAKKKGLPKKTFLHMQWWTLEPDRWVDPSTLILHASMAEVAHSYEGEYAGLDFGADVLFTLKFDDAGNWKIIKTHRMSEKEVEKHQ
jgi:hypothetical protein